MDDEINYTYLLMANSQNLKFAYDNIFRNLPMIAYMIEIKNQNSQVP